VAFGAQPDAVADRAALRVTARAPLAVRGSLFDVGERVVVVAQVKGEHRKVVYATTRGTFAVVFRAIRLATCDAFVVRATGERGHTALVRSARECAPIAPAGP